MRSSSPTRLPAVRFAHSRASTGNTLFLSPYSRSSIAEIFLPDEAFLPVLCALSFEHDQFNRIVRSQAAQVWEGTPMPSLP
jgi:hypothetical protein